MKNWFDPSDTSRLVISPGEYLSHHGIGADTSLSQRLIMFETRAAIPYIVKNYSTRDYTSAVFVLMRVLSDCSLNGLSGTVESDKGIFFNSAYSAELKKFTSRS